MVEPYKNPYTLASEHAEQAESLIQRGQREPLLQHRINFFTEAGAHASLAVYYRTVGDFHR